jgi:hypothetical protein
MIYVDKVTSRQNDLLNVGDENGTDHGIKKLTIPNSIGSHKQAPALDHTNPGPVLKSFLRFLHHRNCFGRQSGK